MSYGVPAALLQNYYLTPPHMEAFASSVSVSRTNLRYWMYKLCKMLGKKDTPVQPDRHPGNSCSQL